MLHIISISYFAMVVSFASACPEFSFSFQIGVALANLEDFTEKLASVSAVMS